MAPQETKEVASEGTTETPRWPHGYRGAQGSAGRTAVKGAPALLTHRASPRHREGGTSRQSAHGQAHHRAQDREGETQKHPEMRTKPEEPGQQTPWGAPGRGEDKGRRRGQNSHGKKGTDTDSSFRKTEGHQHNSRKTPRNRRRTCAQAALGKQTPNHRH